MQMRISVFVPSCSAPVYVCVCVCIHPYIISLRFPIMIAAACLSVPSCFMRVCLCAWQACACAAIQGQVSQCFLPASSPEIQAHVRGDPDRASPHCDSLCPPRIKLFRWGGRCRWSGGWKLGGAGEKYTLKGLRQPKMKW